MQRSEKKTQQNDAKKLPKKLSSLLPRFFQNKTKEKKNSLKVNSQRIFFFCALFYDSCWRFARLSFIIHHLRLLNSQYVQIFLWMKRFRWLKIFSWHKNSPFSCQILSFCDGWWELTGWHFLWNLFLFREKFFLFRA